MERRMTPIDRNDLPPEVRRRFLNTHKKTWISRRLVKMCMDIPRWKLLAATLSSNEEKIYIVDECGFTFLVWVPNAKVVPNSLEAKHYRVQAGPIRDQMYHIICWAYGSSDAVSAERVLKGVDDVFQPLDTRYLVRNACPTKLKLRKDPDGRDHHCCYGYNSLKALKFIKAHGIPKEQNIVFDCTQDPPALGDEELIQFDRIEEYETLEEVFVALESHPVLASLRTFEGWDECGEDVIYEGPLNGAPFSGSHSVLIVSIETINGVAVAVCKSSNGTDVGRDGYLYVSLGVMFMLIAVTKKFPESEHLDKHKDRCDIAPQYLLNRFCWPIIEKPEGSNSRKRKAGNLQSRGADDSDDSIPLSSELAREQAQLASEQRSLSEAGSTPLSHNAASSSDLAVNTVTSVVPSTSSTLPGHASSPIQAGLAVPVTRPPPVAPVTPTSAATSDAEATAMSLVLPMHPHSNDGATAQNSEADNKETSVNGKANVTPTGDKANDEEPTVYATKQEAKAAFKSLLESVNVHSDWTWEQTLKEIVHDKRYGALRTLGERKQAFNEYLGQRKKVEAEERRRRQKKAREEFVKMLEECEELSSSMKWSKAMSLFENDERFKALDRPRDREDLFDNYIVELERKEREKAVEEHRQHMAEYRKFLETCDYIKAGTQWRKIQERLEDDERCSCLEKIDRLIGFEEYILDLEKEEEELKRVEKEHVRRAERKNRDAFRTLLEERVAAGILTAKTYWLDYCIELKDLPQYQAVASNTSGSTPKDLFEDVTEELEKQYHEDKSRVKDAMKSRKVSMVASWLFEDFKSAISEDLSSQPISDINLKLIYDDLLERLKEKEEKEARKLQRLAEEFTNLLRTFKEITAASNWEDTKQLIEESQEYRSIGDETVSKGLFEEYITSLQEKAKEKERKRDEEKVRKEKERDEKEKRKDKEKERREKEREREKERGKERSSKKEESDGETAVDVSEGHKDEKRKGKDRDRKHRRRHHNSDEDISPDRDDREESKKSSRKHGNDRKKSRKHASPESDNENRHKRQKKEQRDSSRRSGNDELEDGEVGEDGEIRH